MAGETSTYKRLTHGAYNTAILQSAPSVQSYTNQGGCAAISGKGDYGPGSAGGPGSIRIAAADLYFTPKPNDQVVIGGKTYQVVPAKTRSPFNGVAIQIVQVRGGNG